MTSIWQLKLTKCGARPCSVLVIHVHGLDQLLLSKWNDPYTADTNLKTITRHLYIAALMSWYKTTDLLKTF